MMYEDQNRILPFIRSGLCAPAPLRENAFRWFMLLVSCCLSPVQAELVWQQRSIRLDVHPLQVEERAVFHFTNTGTEPVDLLSVRTTCDCLKAIPDTNRIEPGASGTLNAVFDFRDKTGPQRKSIAVRSSDNPQKPVILYVEANVPIAYTPEPARLEWRLDGELAPKISRLVNRLTDPMHLTSVESSSEQFITELKPIRDGYEYEVSVVLREDAFPEAAFITVYTGSPDAFEESRTYRIDVFIRRSVEDG